MCVTHGVQDAETRKSFEVFKQQEAEAKAKLECAPADAMHSCSPGPHETCPSIVHAWSFSTSYTTKRRANPSSSNLRFHCTFA